MKKAIWIIGASKISEDYSKVLDALNISYDHWIESISDQSVMTVETDYFNIFEDAKAFNDIQKDILKRL